MPYKDPEKAKASAHRRYLLNSDKIRKRAIQWYKDNKTTVLSQHRGKSDILKEKSKEWRKKNPEKRKAYKKTPIGKRVNKTSKKNSTRKAIDQLKDHYVIHQIKNQTGLSVETIKANPILIENQRQQIKLKRLLKQKKNGKH